MPALTYTRDLTYCTTPSDLGEGLRPTADEVHLFAGRSCTDDGGQPNVIVRGAKLT